MHCRQGSIVMNVKERLRRWFKLRFAILYPFGIFMILFANCDDKSLGSGIPFIIAGELIRLWANGYAIKSEKLTTSGPYAIVRHPLYLGTMLLAVGFIVLLRIYYVGPALLVVMAIVYAGTIRKEERMLEGKFKEYADYRKKVPAMVPTLFPYRGGEKWGFSFERLIRSQEYKPLLWIAALVIVFYLKGKFFVEKEALDSKKLWLMITAALLVMLDIAGEAVKYWKKKHMA